MINKLELCIYPSTSLREKAVAISPIDESIKGLATDMLDIMYSNRGIGLAAPQVGILKRLIVIDLQIDEIKQPIIMVNPVITHKSEITENGEEGCLSLPQIRDFITRFQEISVSYQDLNAKTHNLKASGLLSVCIQHEIDHLNGILFIDHLSALKRQLILKKYKKLNRAET